MEGSKSVNDKVFDEDYTPDELQSYYNKWAEKGGYDKDLSPSNYNGPTEVGKIIEKLYSENQRKRIKILDVAAGTGRVSEELLQVGITNIDALDPCIEMLNVARKKNLYKNYFCEFLTERSLPNLEGTYDCVTVSGGFGQSHLPVRALYDMKRLCKRGGYVVIALREEYLEKPCYKGLLEPEMKKMEKNGDWITLSRTIIPNYAYNLKGVLFVFRVDHA